MITDGWIVRSIITESPKRVEGSVSKGVVVGRGGHRHRVEHVKGPAKVNDHRYGCDGWGGARPRRRRRYRLTRESAHRRVFGKGSRS